MRSELLTVMNHLDIMTGARFTYPVATRLTIDLCGSFLEDRFYFWPSGRITTWHERGAVTCTLLTAGDTSPNKKDAFGFTFFCAANGIGVVRIATIDDNVTWLKIRG